MRILAVALLAAFANAPLQCASDPEPELRRYETPGEALYELATQFKAQGDAKAWKSTLEFLVARYPNSRHAEMARTDLSEAKTDRD